MRTFHIGGAASRSSEEDRIQAKYDGTVKFRNLNSLLNKSKKLFSDKNTFLINESHHIEKKDSPSGTALDLQKEIMSIYSVFGSKLES